MRGETWGDVHVTFDAYGEEGGIVLSTSRCRLLQSFVIRRGAWLVFPSRSHAARSARELSHMLKPAFPTFA